MLTPINTSKRLELAVMRTKLSASVAEVSIQKATQMCRTYLDL